MKSLLTFFISGLIWLFIFSIPVGHEGKKLYSVGYFYLVDTKPVHFVTHFLFSAANKTEKTASEVVNDVVDKVKK